MVRFRYSLILLVSLTSLFFLPSCGFAQNQFQLAVTDNPKELFEKTLRDIEEDGLNSLREFIEGMNMLSPQIETVISVYEQGENATDPKWTTYVGGTQSKALQQHYGYAYLGKNSFLYIRFDFAPKNENDWFLSKFEFNSEYAEVLAMSFDSLNQ